MAKSPFLKSFGFQPNKRRNAFDLGHRHLFTTSAGLLTPFLVNDCNPGDHFEIALTDIIKALNMNSMNFARLNVNVRYFFVPYRLLWSVWPQFITNMTDVNSAALVTNFYTEVGDHNQNANLYSAIPPLRHSYVWQVLREHATFAHPMGCFAIAVYRLASLLGYDPEWFYHYDAKNGFCVWDYDPSGADVPRYVAKKLVPPSDTATSSDYTIGDATDVVISLNSNPDNTGESILFPDLNIFRFLAYQKVWLDWYRNTDWLPYTQLTANLDLFTSDRPIQIGAKGRVLSPYAFAMNTALLPLDFYTSILPGVNYVSSNSHASWDIEHWTGLTVKNTEYSSAAPLESYGVPLSSLNGTVFPSQLKDVTTVAPSGSVRVPRSLDDIRFAYAIERLRMISGRAAKTYSAQIAAHWGEQVNQRDDDRSLLIGEYTHDINTSQIVSTAETSEGTLGQLGAFAQANGNSRRFTFDAHEHGVLLGLVDIEPLIDYQSGFMDRFNLKLTPGDYYQPEFDCLGMQPVEQRDLISIQDGRYQLSGVNNPSVVVGYNNRYMEYKTSRDIVDRLFKASYPTWSVPKSFTDILRVTAAASDIAFDVEKMFYGSPSLLDDLFVAKYNGEPTTDQFLCLFANEVPSVRNMSIDGTPLNLSHLKNS